MDILRDWEGCFQLLSGPAISLKIELELPQLVFLFLPSLQPGEMIPLQFLISKITHLGSQSGLEIHLCFSRHLSVIRCRNSISSNIQTHYLNAHSQQMTLSPTSLRGRNNIIRLLLSQLPFTESKPLAASTTSFAPTTEK